jgi:hypothetical protein
MVWNVVNSLSRIEKKKSRWVIFKIKTRLRRGKEQCSVLHSGAMLISFGFIKQAGYEVK